MKKKYDIRINPDPLTSEDIARSQDFDRVLELYEQQPAAESSPRTPRRRSLLRIAAVAAAAAVAGWFLYVGILAPGSGNYEKEAAAFFAARDYVNPPALPSAKPNFVSRSVDGLDGGELIFANGSRIVVPTDAFEDASGDPVDGEVEVRFREMHDYVDFFLAGIPMVYDSANVRYTLESAGMLEIYAEQNGRRVRLRPGKSIDVELVSELQMPSLNIPPGYNIYKLDTTERRWEYQDVDRLQVVESQFDIDDPEHPLYQLQQAQADALAQLELEKEQALATMAESIPVPELPQQPMLYDPDAFVFDFAVNGDTESPEGALWQLAPGQDIDAEALNRPWAAMELEQRNGRDYHLTLTAEDAELEVLVIPVLSGTDYEAAMSAYEREMTQYQDLMASHHERLNRERTIILDRYALEQARLQAEFRDAVEDFQSESQLAALPLMRHKVVNRFRANSFGIWNCDRPVAPRMAQVRGTFTDEEGNVIQEQVAYLADKSRNTIERIYLSDKTPIRFNTNSKNLLWIVTEEQQLAIFRPEDFAELDLEADSQTFVMEITDHRIESEADVREILYF